MQQNARQISGITTSIEQQAFCYNSSCRTILWINNTGDAIEATSEELSGLTRAIISRIRSSLDRIEQSLSPVDPDAMTSATKTVARLTADLAAIALAAAFAPMIPA